MSEGRDFEIGKVLGSIDSLVTKIEANTNSIRKLESCMAESKKDGREEIINIRRENKEIKEKMDKVLDQLSIYSTTIKVVKTIFYGVILIATFKLGDVRELIGNIWK